jgi:hypothetical protein
MVQNTWGYEKKGAVDFQGPYINTALNVLLMYSYFVINIFLLS